MVMNNDALKQGPPLKTQARQLAESDDIASSLVLDSMLGFVTHKMAARFRPLKVDQEIVKKALERYAKDGDTEQAYNEIVFNGGDWGRCYFITKSKPQIAAFKEHVSLAFFTPSGSLVLLKCITFVFLSFYNNYDIVLI